MASINNIINVSLSADSPLAARENMNNVAIMTSQQSGPVSSANRYGLHRDQASVATAYGSSSDIALFAGAFFGTQSNPIGVGGVLIVGYYRGAAENVAATSAVLTGSQVSEVALIPQLQVVSDGALNIDIDGTTDALTALDFSATTTMDEVVAVLDAALTGASAEWINQAVVITSDTTGATSLLSLASEPGTGTYIGALLGIGAGTGAAVVNGSAAVTLPIETKVDAMTALKAAIGVKGFCFIDATTDAESEALADWSQSNGVLGYDVFSAPSNLLISTANPVWKIKLAGKTNYRMLYSPNNNRSMAASYMARLHVVNFGAENSAMTMNLQDLSVSAEEYTEAEIIAAKKVGLDVYPVVAGVPSVLCSGANGWADDRYNILAYINAVQVDQFNTLKQPTTKIPQTNPGVQVLVDQAEKTTREFVRAGVFAPGTWSSSTRFGDTDTFNRAIDEQGFYVLAGDLADQSQADRMARKAPVLQVAVKSSGAIHSLDVIINFNV